MKNFILALPLLMSSALFAADQNAQFERDLRKAVQESLAPADEDADLQEALKLSLQESTPFTPQTASTTKTEAGEDDADLQEALKLSLQESTPSTPQTSLKTERENEKAQARDEKEKKAVPPVAQSSSSLSKTVTDQKAKEDAAKSASLQLQEIRKAQALRHQNARQTLEPSSTTTMQQLPALSQPSSSQVSSAANPLMDQLGQFLGKLSPTTPSKNPAWSNFVRTIGNAMLPTLLEGYVKKLDVSRFTDDQLYGHLNRTEPLKFLGHTFNVKVLNKESEKELIKLLRQGYTYAGVSVVSEDPTIPQFTYSLKVKKGTDERSITVNITP